MIGTLIIRAKVKVVKMTVNNDLKRPKLHYKGLLSLLWYQKHAPCPLLGLGVGNGEGGVVLFVVLQGGTRARTRLLGKERCFYMKDKNSSYHIKQTLFKLARN